MVILQVIILKEHINEALEIAGLIGMAVAGGALATALGAIAIKGVNRYVR